MAPVGSMVVVVVVARLAELGLVESVAVVEPVATLFPA